VNEPERQARWVVHERPLHHERKRAQLPTREMAAVPLSTAMDTLTLPPLSGWAARRRGGSRGVPSSRGGAWAAGRWPRLT
jgi:hypothetical protein